MKLWMGLLLVLFFEGCAKEVKMPHVENPKIAHTFQALWDALNSDKLEHLPQNTVSFWKLGDIAKDSKRTLESRADILAPFHKLAHPNGICLKGLWQIDVENPYGGYFKKGSKALIVMRASSALSETKAGGFRAFGFAGKLFPTMKPSAVIQERTANFFLIDDLGGTQARYYTDTAMSNEPEVSVTREVLKNLAYALKVAGAFSKADKHSGIRQLYEVSYLGEGQSKNIITPKWMKVQAQKTELVDAKDFRDELRIKAKKGLVFDIFVASKEVKGQKSWQKIGTIALDDAVVSGSCDQRLHFHHPGWRDDLIYY